MIQLSDGQSSTAQFVRQLRTRTGLTQERFGEKFGIPRRTLLSWEVGERTPPAYVVDMMARIIDLEQR